MGRVRYRNGRRRSIPLTPEELKRTKTCNRCGETKPWGEFHMRRRPSGLRHPLNNCAQCFASRRRRRIEENPEAVKEYNERRMSRFRRLDIAAMGYEPHACEICGQFFAGKGHAGAHYDHNHGTTKARGWLCTGCNTGLGCLGDNPEILERAIEYLRTRGYSQSRPVFR